MKKFLGLLLLLSTFVASLPAGAWEEGVVQLRWKEGQGGTGYAYGIVDMKWRLAIRGGEALVDVIMVKNCEVPPYSYYYNNEQIGDFAMQHGIAPPPCPAYVENATFDVTLVGGRQEVRTPLWTTSSMTHTIGKLETVFGHKPSEEELQHFRSTFNVEPGRIDAPRLNDALESRFKQFRRDEREKAARAQRELEVKQAEEARKKAPTPEKSTKETSSSSSPDESPQPAESETAPTPSTPSPTTPTWTPNDDGGFKARGEQAQRELDAMSQRNIDNAMESNPLGMIIGIGGAAAVVVVVVAMLPFLRGLSSNLDLGGSGSPPPESVPYRVETNGF